MKSTQWVHVGADPKTVKEASELAEELAEVGFTQAQILRAGLAFGVKAIKTDRSILIAPAGSRKK